MRGSLPGQASVSDIALALAPLSVTAFAVLVRPALRYLVLLVGMIIATRGAHTDERIRAYIALATALTPADPSAIRHAVDASDAAQRSAGASQAS